MRQRPVSLPRSSNRTCGFLSIRLSDRLHREAHDVAPIARGVCATGANIFASRHSPFGRVRPFYFGVCRPKANHLGIPVVTSAPEVRVLSSASVTRLHRSYDPVRLPLTSPSKTASRPLPSCQTGLPRLLASPFQRALPTTPANQMGASIDCFPIHAAFPGNPAGRRSHPDFRGLLGLHSRYRPLDRSTAQGGLCHEAPARPVTRQDRSSATRSIDNSLGGTFLHW
jgi:hypothetical protein